MVFTTLIPTRRNDGSPVPRAELQEILSGLWTRFGGVTIDGIVTGHWIDSHDGQHYQDESLKVSIACDNDRLQDAESAVVEVGKRLEQKAMYFEVRYFDGVRFLRVTTDA